MHRLLADNNTVTEVCTLLCALLLYPTAFVGRYSTAMGGVRLSVFNPSFELAGLCRSIGHGHSSPRIEIHGQRSMQNVCYIPVIICCSVVTSYKYSLMV